ncbi:unnamed protein product [Mortierella alpina]
MGLSIAAFGLVSFNIAVFGIYNYQWWVDPGQFTWQMWCQTFLCLCFLVTYICITLVDRPKIPRRYRFVRAVVLVGLTAFSLYINLEALRNPDDRTLTPASYVDVDMDMEMEMGGDGEMIHPMRERQGSLARIFIRFPQGVCVVLGLFSIAEMVLTLVLEGRTPKIASIEE